MDNAYIYARPHTHTRGRVLWIAAGGGRRVRRDDGYYGCQGGMDDRADQ